MSLYKIIKAAEVQEELLHILPLRRYTTAQDLSGMNEVNDAVTSQLATAKAQAEEIIRKARAQADEVARQAQLAGESIKEEAYRSAFEKGRQEGNDAGYQEGMAKASEEAASIRVQAAEVLEQAEKIHRHILETVEQEIVDLAMEIAEKLLSTKLAMEPGLVMQVAKESLLLVADRLSVVLYINPLEIELVENRKSELHEVLPARAQLQVIADSSVKPGGCRVETEQGWVDATMETRREELIKALYNRER